MIIDHTGVWTSAGASRRSLVVTHHRSLASLLHLKLNTVQRRGMDPVLDQSCGTIATGFIFKCYINSVFVIQC